MLYTRELKETIEFYQDILEFDCSQFAPEWGWASLVRNDIRIMLSLPNDHIPFTEPNFTGSFYFTIDDVELYYEKIKSRIKLEYPMEDFNYGMREFAFRDNNGYLLQFGSEISPD